MDPEGQYLCFVGDARSLPSGIEFTNTEATSERSLNGTKSLSCSVGPLKLLAINEYVTVSTSLCGPVNGYIEDL
jgi:hypothetical protein